MTRSVSTLIKFAIFGLVMAVLTAFLFLVFSDTRTGPANEYSAVFKDASRLKSGDTVRIAGIRVGTVKDVELQADRSVLVTFDADKNTVLTRHPGRNPVPQPRRRSLSGARRHPRLHPDRPGWRSDSRGPDSSGA